MNRETSTRMAINHIATLQKLMAITSDPSEVQNVLDDMYSYINLVESRWLAYDQANADSQNYIAEYRNHWDDNGDWVGSDVTAMTWTEVVQYDERRAAYAADCLANPIIVERDDKHWLITRGDQYMIFPVLAENSDSDENWGAWFNEPDDSWDTDNIAEARQRIWDELCYGRSTGVEINDHIYMRYAPCLVRRVR